LTIAFVVSLAITIAVAVGRFPELLPWRSKNCIQKLKQGMLTLFYFDWTVGNALIKAG
jgi:hypothetical protein